MNKTIYQVDSFTDTPFKGNPAGVMFCDIPMTDQCMQNIAMEMNVSETAFITAAGDHFQIRYFTPLTEVPLCGHATLAGAHLIYELGLRKETEPYLLKAAGGDLLVSKQDGWITMVFPCYPLEKKDIPVNFEQWVGFRPVELYASIYDWVVAVAGSDSEIEQAAPDFEKLVSNKLGHLMITAPSNRKNVDFTVRCFAPAMGINEDPVTGSAHCALTPLWSRKLNKTTMNSLQLSKRTGQLKVKLTGDNRVQIQGQAITVLEGKFKSEGAITKAGKLLE